MYFNFNNFRYWKGINNHFSHDTMKNRDKKTLPSAHGNIPFITDYYDSNKRWIKEIKKNVNIQSQYRYKSRSPRGPDEVLESKGSLPVWRSGSNLDFHRVTFWNVDGLRREYVDFHSMEPKTNCKMHAPVKTLHDNRHVKLS